MRTEIGQSALMRISLNIVGVNKRNHKWEKHMNWNASVVSSALSADASVEVSRYFLEGEVATNPAVGDSLSIEFPDNSRAGGNVESASLSTIAVSINGASSTWEQQGSSQLKAGRLLSLSYIVR